MSRSVSVASGAAVVVYTHFDAVAEDTAYDDFQDLIADFRAALHAAFPSVTKDDRWLDREDHVIASNRHADFGLSEYMGLVSCWIVPRIDHDSYANTNGLKRQWASKAEDTFRKVVRNVFGDELRKLGTASNGESFYEQVTP